MLCMIGVQLLQRPRFSVNPRRRDEWDGENPTKRQGNQFCMAEEIFEIIRHVRFQRRLGGSTG